LDTRAKDMLFYPWIDYLIVSMKLKDNLFVIEPR